MAVMNETAPETTVPEPPRRSGTDTFFDSVRGIGVVRTQDRWIAGVSGGLARRFAIDPVVVRGLLAVSVLLGGIGLVLYGIAWLLLPEEADGRIHAQQLLHGDVNVAVLGAAGAIVMGLSVPTAWTPWFWDGGNGDAGDWFRGLAWFAAIALVVVAVVTAMRSRDRGSPPSTRLPRPAPGAPYQAFYPTGPATPPPPGPTGPAFTTPVSTGGQMSTDTTGESPVTTPLASTSPVTTAPLGTSQPTNPPAPTWQGGGYGGPPGSTGGYAGYGGYGGTGGSGPAMTLPRTERNGASAVLGVVTALTLLALAGLLLADRAGIYDGPIAATTAAIALVLLGLGITFQGMRGRGAGGLTALAIVGLLVAGPMAAATHWDGEWVDSAAVGELTNTPDTVSAAQEGVQLGLGTAVLDLTEVPLTATPVVVPIQVGAGELTVVLPDDVAASATISVGAGEVTWLDEQVVSGTGNRTDTYLTPTAEDGEPVQIELDIRVGLGTVNVKEN